MCVGKENIHIYDYCSYTWISFCTPQNCYPILSIFSMNERQKKEFNLKRNRENKTIKKTHYNSENLKGINIFLKILYLCQTI